MFNNLHFIWMWSPVPTMAVILCLNHWLTEVPYTSRWSFQSRSEEGVLPAILLWHLLTRQAPHTVRNLILFWKEEVWSLGALVLPLAPVSPTLIWSSS